VGSNINIKDTLNADGAGMTQMADALEKVHCERLLDQAAGLPTIKLGIRHMHCV
jgi:hypothetical protein